MSMSSPTLVPPKSTDNDCGCSQQTSADADTSNPFETSIAAVRGGANLYGAFSIETFCDQGPLSLTHEDAGGFLDYVRQFNQPNFWYQDSGVRVWAYYEDYDNWQDTYGMDAVKVAYHSGHGGMDGNGVFYAPMGSAWAGNDCTATSNNMRLGNEHAKYIFWSTCFSCRVLDGHSPIRTWQAANQGFRMLFGYETVSIDSGDYGKFFWQEWNANKSFSQAWLDASWRIAHNQAPSAMAVGATSEEAANVLYNERFFSNTTPSTNWWQWRWYYASSLARAPMLSLPSHALVGQLQPIEIDQRAAQKLARQFNIELPQKASASADRDGFSFATGNTSMALKPDGAFDIQLAKPDHSYRGSMSMDLAQAKANAAIQQYGLAGNANLVLDRVLHSYQAGGTNKGSGEREDARITGTVVQFRQTINGIPVITPDSGVIRVSMDNTGTVTNLHSSVRAVEALSERGRQSQPSPRAPGLAHDIAPEDYGFEQALAAKFAMQLSRMAASGRMPLGFSIVPDTTEVGYSFKNGETVIVARRQVEVDFGGGYRKRYWTEVPVA
jgi:Family of unknown function (DUF6345)